MIQAIISLAIPLLGIFIEWKILGELKVISDESKTRREMDENIKKFQKVLADLKE